MEKMRALIGMSGGVDSSVAAFLMKEQGYHCLGATMVLHDGAEGDASDARAVADRLGMEHRVFDLQEAFRKEVMDRFTAAYEAGLTPNPCISCNKYLKFGRLLDLALDQGCDYVVSGHYARVRQDEVTGRYLLYKASDRDKDQTYFLAGLSQDQLKHIRFPLGELTKEEVRKIAESQNFGNARKKDSQDICFVPDGDYRAFLERYTGKTYPQGDYLDREGRVLGRHQGAVGYTLGQRKGLGIALGAPAYVCGKDMEKNTVTLGPNEALFSSVLWGEDFVFFPFPALTEPMAVTVKIRHSRQEAGAMAYPEGEGRVRVEFQEPQRAVTPGQAVVLYQGDLVIGGGTIAGGDGNGEYKTQNAK